MAKCCRNVENVLIQLLLYQLTSQTYITWVQETKRYIINRRDFVFMKVLLRPLNYQNKIHSEVCKRLNMVLTALCFLSFKCCWFFCFGDLNRKHQENERIRRRLNSLIILLLQWLQSKRYPNLKTSSSLNQIIYLDHPCVAQDFFDRVLIKDISISDY